MGAAGGLRPLYRLRGCMQLPAMWGATLGMSHSIACAWVWYHPAEQRRQHQHQHDQHRQPDRHRPSASPRCLLALIHGSPEHAVVQVQHGAAPVGLAACHVSSVLQAAAAVAALSRAPEAVGQVVVCL